MLWPERATTIILFLVSGTAGAADALLLDPLHLARQVGDQLWNSPAQVEEFCSGRPDGSAVLGKSSARVAFINAYA